MCASCGYIPDPGFYALVQKQREKVHGGNTKMVLLMMSSDEQTLVIAL